MSRRIEYSQDQWLELVASIEDDGGHQSEDEYGYPDNCGTRTYSFVGPHKLDPKDRVIEGCGKDALFEVCYDPHEHVHLELEPRDFLGHTPDDPQYRRDDGDDIVIDHTGEAGALSTEQSVLVCAICDGIGWWPRYAHVMESD